MCYVLASKEAVNAMVLRRQVQFIECIECINVTVSVSLASEEYNNSMNSTFMLFY